MRDEIPMPRPRAAGAMLAVAAIALIALPIRAEGATSSPKVAAAREKQTLHVSTAVTESESPPALPASEEDDGNGVSVWREGSPECGPDPFDYRTDIPYYCENYHDDANDLPGGESGSELEPQLQAAFGSRYVGKWIDRTASPSRWGISIVDASPADHQAVGLMLGGSDRYIVTPATYSKLQLDQFMAVIVPLVQARSIESAIGVDVVMNKVTGRVDSLDPRLIPSILEAGVPAAAFLVTSGFDAEPVHSSRRDYPNYEGGLFVKTCPDSLCGTSGYVSKCTTGFTMATDAVNFKGTTAGHCDYWTGTKAKMGDPLQSVNATGTNTFVGL
ncbi:MAG TPA: hypothetical protein VGB83_10835 [Actinomycetota bacterium]